MDIRPSKKQTLSINPKTKKCIIDTDAGGDDAQALIFAINQAKLKNIQIIGITCVNGNTFVTEVVKNVAIVQALCSSKISIYEGAQQSLLGSKQKDFFFSQDGIGTKQQQYWNELKKQNRLLDDSLIVKDKTAAEFIAESAIKYAGQISIIAIGPLTNLALAYWIDPSIGVGKFNAVSIMGGTDSGIGIRHFFAAEFNFFLDPQAAKIIIQEFNNVFIATFDFTFGIDQKQMISSFTDKTTQKGRFVNDIYQVIMAQMQPMVCDPIAAIPIFCPELIEQYHEVTGHVELVGARTRGCIVYDWLAEKNEIAEDKRKVKILSKINVEKFLEGIMNSYKDTLM